MVLFLFFAFIETSNSYSETLLLKGGICKQLPVFGWIRFYFTILGLLIVIFQVKTSIKLLLNFAIKSVAEIEESFFNYNLFAELYLNAANLGSARFNFLKNLPKTLITMKLTTNGFSGFFKKQEGFGVLAKIHWQVASRLWRVSSDIFSWMILHHIGFRFLFSSFRVPSCVGDFRGGLFSRLLVLLRFSYLPGWPPWMCFFDTAHFESFIEIL